MAGQIVGYIRVSTAEQNLTRQIEALGHVDKLFQDEVSAKSREDRPGLAACLDYLRDGDTLIVSSIDRLARSLTDLRQIIDETTAKGVTVKFLKESLLFAPTDNDPRATLMLGILGSFAEFERSLIRERQAEGIAQAKKAGKYLGRTPVLSTEQRQEISRRAHEGESRTHLASEFKVSRSTIYRALKTSEK